ncbi:MAG: DUF2851 family protein [Candidatus Hydrogenedentota bacterium]
MMAFRETYGELRRPHVCVAEDTGVAEEVVQHIWHELAFATDNLITDDGRTLRIVSPGWWNHAEGPDFRGAQLEFNGRLRDGDVEVHLTHAAWKQHGHDGDPRFDRVRLIAVLEKRPPRQPPHTSSGRRISCLLLGNLLKEDIDSLAERLPLYREPAQSPAAHGACAALTQRFGTENMNELVRLAGEWRMVQKAQLLRERIAYVGAEQAIYEALLRACGYSRYKHQFRVTAEQLPYERARQLAKQDAHLLEAAYLQLTGLMPGSLNEEAAGFAHFSRLEALRQKHLPGLRSIPLEWPRLNTRPINYPERRIAGMARFVSRTAAEGLLATLDRLWAEDYSPVARRKAFEALFPRGMGFWAEHCTWSGKPLHRPIAPIGKGRVRSMIGNVFVPAAIALARERGERALEEKVLAFFARLPQEPGNRVVTRMLPRIYGENAHPRLDFRMQQGLLQLFGDWCESNPSCRNCPVLLRLGGPDGPAQGYGS